MIKKQVYEEPNVVVCMVNTEKRFLLGSNTPTSKSGGSTVEDGAEYSGSSIWG